MAFLRSHRRLLSDNDELDLSLIQPPQRVQLVLTPNNAEQKRNKQIS